MENQYEHLQLSVGHEGLFGSKISQEELIVIISRYPATLWLDLFSKIEGFLIIPRGKDFNAHEFLVDNLFCPSAIERTRRKANVGNVYFSLGQLNLLRKLAILYGNDANQTEIEKIDISKVLLAAQDIHNAYDESVGGGSTENFFKFVVRNGYLNGNTDSSTLLFRAKKMYVDQANKVPFCPEKSFLVFFEEKVGITPEEVLALSFALTTPFFQSKETLFGQTTIISDFFRRTTIDVSKIDSVIDSMLVDFETIKQSISSELSGKDLCTLPAGHDLGAFRRTPLIRLSDGRLIFGNLSCLFEKTTQNMIWMSVGETRDEERKDLVNYLTSYRGRLFEEYLKELCSIMTEKNKKLSFAHVPPDATTDHEEVGDSILIQGNKLVIFEAKSRQFLESFKTTGNWEKDPKFIAEFTKAAKQIETAATKIRSRVVTNLNINATLIEKIYPVIVTYESIPMYGKVQRYIRQKVREAGHLTDPMFAPLEVVTIGDIEQIIDSVNTVSLIDLLSEKNSGDSHASESNLHNFFARYLSENTVICNGWQREQVDKTVNEVFSPFFKDKFK